MSGGEAGESGWRKGADFFVRQAITLLRMAMGWFGLVWFTIVILGGPSSKWGGGRSSALISDGTPCTGWTGAGGCNSASVVRVVLGGR